MSVLFSGDQGFGSKSCEQRNISSDRESVGENCELSPLDSNAASVCQHVQAGSTSLTVEVDVLKVRQGRLVGVHFFLVVEEEVL